MKRVLILAFCIIVMAGAFGSENIVVLNEDVTAVSPYGGDPVEIKVADLPQAVKAALKGDAYKGWTAEETAHKITKEDGTVYYKITFKSATSDETKVIKFDADGKEVERPDK